MKKKIKPSRARECEIKKDFDEKIRYKLIAGRLRGPSNHPQPTVLTDHMEPVGSKIDLKC